MYNGKNSALRGFGSQVWHRIIGQVALRENGTDVSGASQFLNPPSKHFVQIHWENMHLVSASATQQKV